MIARNDATQAQVDAANPAASTWLSANAGSGKTRVLTDRVARLLLGGALPERILCLTYTKAAASEMQNRLFKRLGAWAMKDDAALAQELAELGEEGPFTDGDLNDARTLFARAIEAPGGLKIQTIHSFCATLLRRFPLEAGVSPQFREMEDRAAALLRADVIERLTEGPEAGLVAELALGLSDESFDEIATEVLSRRAELTPPVRAEEAFDWFGVPKGQTEADITAMALAPGDLSLLGALVAVFASGSSNDIKAADKLRGIHQLDGSALPVLENVFLTGPRTKNGVQPKIGTLPTKTTQKTMDPALLDRLNDWMEAVAAAREARIAHTAARRTVALHAFAGAFIPAYDAAKARLGVLDFDDLIDRARALLTNPRVAEWVLYRLDGGIDHILVDEAQDTSPRQWQVIDRLALEITSGQGTAEDRARTLFVVGDKKQSIYSFQGADPGAFDEMQDDFDSRLAPGPTPLNRRTLEFSFRSSPVILDLVDETFRGREASGFGTGARHKAFHAEMPGQVDLWPVVPTPEKPEDPAFEDPVDTVREDDARSVLAHRIATELRRMIDTRTPIATFDKDAKVWASRPMRPGDVLILVQSRGVLFDQIIRALKVAGVPTAGTDRLKVGGELAVRDLRALLSVLATPEDDLSLATVLKSPLFGWTEQQLYTLAHHRTERFLWQALRDGHPGDAAMLHDLMGQADFLRPYDLIERILTRHGGRARLLARLGPEAEDGINALLSQALSYEQGEIPSLTGFLAWMETDDLEIKRQISQSADQVRVMSVHGAKGLEAPVVILPDTGLKKNDLRGQTLAHDGRALWKTPADETPPLVQTAIDAARAKQAQEKDRLLYVAMTRAEQRLIVCAAGELGKDGNSWHDRIAAGLQARGAVDTLHDFADAPASLVTRLSGVPFADIGRDPGATDPPASASLAPWARTVAPTPPVAAAHITPSDLGGAKVMPGDAGQDLDTALRFGTLVHLLLEHLPALDPSEWQAATQALAPAEDALWPAALEHVAACMASDALRPLWAPDSLIEVPVTAPLAPIGGTRMVGIVDRLIIADDHVLIADFKTNATVPAAPADVPEGLLRQMGAYAAAMAQVFPDKRIDTAIVWTRTGALMPLPHNMVMQALARAEHLDDATPTA